MRWRQGLAVPVLIVLLTCFRAAALAEVPSSLPSIVLEQIATGLASPVSLTHAGDGTGRLFIVQQQGKIMIYDGTKVLPTPFLDLTSLVSCCGEQGLLGLAFHPNYANNGFFYVDYTNSSGNTVIARYKVSANANIADPASALILLPIAQPANNHNGGQLQFGPDGYLYIGMGDGGGQGDPDNRAQNLGELLGKILRIDVNAGSPYAVPPSNPFVGTQGARPEIWALGLRNPWRFSFDRLTGDLFIGDVGQDAREEVDLQLATSAGGENYGWRRMEGTACYNPTSGCSSAAFTSPILEYPHASGDCTVIAGYRYRGTQIAGLEGAYIYGDFCTGRIWGATPSGAVWSSVQLLDLPFRISTFGEDQAGELYVAEYSAGTIYRIKSTTPPVTPGVINVASAISDGGFTYVVNQNFGTPGDTNATPTISVLRIFENGIELGPPHSMHADIRNFGGGRFSHWNGNLFFSASNNTDPRTNGRTYTYQVGSSPIIPPAAPSGLAATATSSSTITLTWTDQSANESGFKIERALGAGAFSPVVTVGANITTYADSGLTANTSYSYRVRATNTAGDSAYSNTASATTLPSIPAAPTGLTATATSSSTITLTWTDQSANESGFKIERALGAGAFSPVVTVGANTTTYADSGLTANTSYSYRVRATNTAGDSANSNTASATTAATTANAINVAAAISDGGFTYVVNQNFGTPGDTNATPTTSVLRIFENGIELGPPHSTHADIGTLGGGRFSHWGGNLFFSASNNTDPRTNGRTYTYQIGSQ